MKSADERKNEAAYIFAKWLTQKENNLRFVTEAGYMPVKNDALEALFENTDKIENNSQKNLYNTVSSMSREYTFIPIPLFDGASRVQQNFENKIKPVLKSSHNQYLSRVQAGEDADAVLKELTASSLSEFRALCNS